VGVIAALCASCIVMLTQRARLVGAGLLASILAAGFGLTFVQWTQPVGQPITVRLLQGNIAQTSKFDPEHIARALELYRSMVMAEPADLIALPETAIARIPQNLPPDYLPSLQQYAASSGSHLMFGIPIADGPGMVANSVVGMSPAGQAYRFDKQHLVPFGEFVPAGFRWFVDMMRMPLGDMTRGAEVQAPFPVKDQLVLPNVCYEDVFGEEIALQLRSSARPATMLLNVSNLAWFGESVAIPQHLQISQMRSIETGRPMLRATNTGTQLRVRHRQDHGAGHGRHDAVYPLWQLHLPAAGRSCACRSLCAVAAPPPGGVTGVAEASLSGPGRLLTSYRAALLHVVPSPGRWHGNAADHPEPSKFHSKLT
jgi:apolipoprotein N-acyltransferase